VTRVYKSSFHCPRCKEYAPVLQKSKRAWGIRRQRKCKKCKRKFGTYQKHDEDEKFDCWLLNENRNSPEYRKKRENYKKLKSIVEPGSRLDIILEMARIKEGVFKL